jgi:hypothetical protein
MSSPDEPPKEKARKKRKPHETDAPSEDEQPVPVDGGEDEAELPDEAWQPSEQETDAEGRPRPVRPQAPPKAKDVETGAR